MSYAIQKVRILYRDGGVETFVGFHYAGNELCYSSKMGGWRISAQQTPGMLRLERRGTPDHLLVTRHTPVAVMVPLDRVVSIVETLALEPPKEPYNWVSGEGIV